MGDGDMKAMVQLDSDKARLHSKGDQAARDIVQFVREFFYWSVSPRIGFRRVRMSIHQSDWIVGFTHPPSDLNTYLPCGSLDPSDFQHELEAPRARLSLARAVLQEIPRQVKLQCNLCA